MDRLSYMEYIEKQCLAFFMVIRNKMRQGKMGSVDGEAYIKHSLWMNLSCRLRDSSVTF